MREIRLYFEGSPKLRPGFAAFFSGLREIARRHRCGFSLIATRGTPVRDFKTALRQHPDAWNILLKDSDGAHTETLSAEFCHRENIPRQHAASVFWMVQIMESWFLADTAALREYYEQGFSSEGLRIGPDVELVPKADVYQKLKTATRHTQKGEYHKTKHAPDLLERINPDEVQAGSRECKRLRSSLERFALNG